MPKWSDKEQTFAKALQKELGKAEVGMSSEVRPLKGPPETFIGTGSGDQAEVSLVAPMATVSFPIVPPGGNFHHWSFVASSYGSGAWKGLNAGAKAMAASAIDLLTRPEELKKVKDEFEERSKKYPYRPFLPADAKPPLDFYEELMNKFRPFMEPHYLDPESGEK